MAKRKAGDTKGKLLAAAGEVFCEKGYRKATVWEICSRAGANISAVSYHFGSKEALYRQAWRHSFAESINLHPPDGGVGETAAAEVRLWGQVKALLERISDRNNRDFLISQLELLDPTGLLEEVITSDIVPLRKKTLTLVRELLGDGASEQVVLFCETCIISMCLHPVLIQRGRHWEDGAGMPAVIDDIELFAHRVVKFSLAGIAAFSGGCNQ